MKFVILKVGIIPNERVVLRERCYEGFYSATLGYLSTVRTFNENDENLVLRERADFIETRPKGIYKGSNGYYIKKEKKHIYLKNVEEIEKAIEEMRNKITLEDKKNG